MPSKLPVQALRALWSPTGADTELKLPSGCLLLVVQGECEVRVLAGELREPRAHASKVLDARLARAVLAMQEAPHRRYTVSGLAKLAGMSRAAFAKAFVASTGTTPRSWLSELRLQLAAELLQQGELALAALAERVGYASAFALSRAFKRRFGVAPAHFKKSLRGAHLPIRAAA